MKCKVKFIQHWLFTFQCNLIPLFVLFKEQMYEKELRKNLENWEKKKLSIVGNNFPQLETSTLNTHTDRQTCQWTRDLTTWTWTNPNADLNVVRCLLYYLKSCKYCLSPNPVGSLESNMNMCLNLGFMIWKHNCPKTVPLKSSC